MDKKGFFSESYARMPAARATLLAVARWSPLIMLTSILDSFSFSIEFWTPSRSLSSRAKQATKVRSLSKISRSDSFSKLL